MIKQNRHIWVLTYNPRWHPIPNEMAYDRWFPTEEAARRWIAKHKSTILFPKCLVICDEYIEEADKDAP